MHGGEEAQAGESRTEFWSCPTSFAAKHSCATTDIISRVVLGLILNERLVCGL